MGRYASFVIFVLVVGACAQDTAPADTEATTETLAPAETTTTETPTTTESPTPTTVPPTTTTTTPGVRSAAEALAGDYEGEWRNLTFGSSGAAAASIVVSGDNVVIVFNLDGQVFGQADPEPQTITLPLEGLASGTVEGDSELFGPFTMTVSADGFVLEAQAIPAAGIASMTVTGTIDANSIEGTYEIGFEGGGGANGEFEMTR